MPRVGHRLVAVLALLLVSAAGASAADFYVSPSGSAGGNGSLGSPWDLGTALSHPAAVRPGDTIWLRGGVYQQGGDYYSYISRLNGAPGAPIRVRQYPGERATLDARGASVAGLNTQGSWTEFWDFEVTNTDPNRNGERASGVWMRPSHHIKLINMAIHDAGQGIGAWPQSPDSEIYGCLIYYNGGNSNLGHGIYNGSSTGIWQFSDNMIFFNLSHGLHAYTSNGGSLNNIRVEGNALFSNGLAVGGVKPNLLIGGESDSEIARNSVVSNNYGYANLEAAAGRDLQNFGYNRGCTGLSLSGNYFVGLTNLSNCTNYSISGNTFIGGTQGFAPASFPGNTYSAGRPSGTKVVVRPNAHQPGRAHIVVYNWDRQSAVDVNPGSVLANGDAFEVRNAQNYFGAPVLSGTYNGSALRLPMTGLQAAGPVGFPGPPATGPEFNAFVLIRVAAGASGCDRTYGDLNQDGSVNATDLVILGNSLVGNLTQGPPPFTAPSSRADLDRSGRVDALDHVILQSFLVGNLTCLPR